MIKEKSTILSRTLMADQITFSILEMRLSALKARAYQVKLRFSEQTIQSSHIASESFCTVIL